jgi:hypothetical protein
MVRCPSVPFLLFIDISLNNRYTSRYPLYWLLRASVRKIDNSIFHHPPVCLCHVVLNHERTAGFSLAREKGSPTYEKNVRFLAEYTQGSHARLHYRPAKSTFTHDATNWMHLVHRLYYRTCSTGSGHPLVVMMEPTQYWNSNHLVPCIMRGMRRAPRFRNLLLNSLMRSGLIEVHHIPIEHALELLLVENEQVVKAFLSYTSQQAFADRISSGSVIGCVENLHGTRGRHSSETGAKFTIVIPNQILWCLPIRRGFSERYAPPMDQ